MLCALGVSTAMAAAGCSGRSIDGGDDSVGDDDGTSDDTATSGGSTSGDVTTSVGDDDGDTGQARVCVADPDVPQEVAFCVPAPGSGQCGACEDETCQQAALQAGNEANVCVCGCSFIMQTCGPETVDDACCYKVLVEDQGCIGRPFVVGGEPRQAVAVHRRDWTSAQAPDTALPTAIAQALAEHWQQVALAEHASVASFARFCLDLLSLGAPPELLARAQRAMADEIEHARLGFALASAYAARPIGPGALATADPSAGSRDAAAILTDAIVEGCIGETVSAAEAAAAAETATDPVVRRVLAKIAADETRHGALAWRFVQWLLHARPQLRATAAACFARACELPTTTPATEDAWSLRPHGVPSPAARAQLRREALQTIVQPCADMLVRGIDTQPEPTSHRTLIEINRPPGTALPHDGCVARR
jgi:hypothetical protein